MQRGQERQPLVATHSGFLRKGVSHLELEAALRSDVATVQQLTPRPETALSRIVFGLSVAVRQDLPRTLADGRSGMRTRVGLGLASLRKRIRVTFAEQPKPARCSSWRVKLIETDRCLPLSYLQELLISVVLLDRIAAGMG